MPEIQPTNSRTGWMHTCLICDAQPGRALRRTLPQSARLSYCRLTHTFASFNMTNTFGYKSVMTTQATKLRPHPPTTRQTKKNGKHPSSAGFPHGRFQLRNPPPASQALTRRARPQPFRSARAGGAAAAAVIAVANAAAASSSPPPA